MLNSRHFIRLIKCIAPSFMLYSFVLISLLVIFFVIGPLIRQLVSKECSKIHRKEKKKSRASACRVLHFDTVVPLARFFFWARLVAGGSVIWNSPEENSENQEVPVQVDDLIEDESTKEECQGGVLEGNRSERKGREDSLEASQRQGESGLSSRERRCGGRSTAKRRVIDIPH